MIITPCTRTICFTVLFLFSLKSSAQQVPDNDYTPPSFKARYNEHSGSVVMIDEAHNNFHTIENRYAPFAKVLSEDGYKVENGTKRFDANTLKGVKILVIANALNEVNLKQWALPTPSAFSPDEIKVLVEWVRNGGSLFLIADHMPFAGATHDLAKEFGFDLYNSFALNAETFKSGRPDIFRREDGTFRSGELAGIDSVDSIATFTGEGFTIPAQAVSILTLNDHFKILLPEVAWKFDKNTTKVDGEGKSQGAYLKFGKGRVVMFGEAAMFSAQKTGDKKMGMNTADGGKNYLLLLSLIHWLDARG